jgi:putative transposase
MYIYRTLSSDDQEKVINYRRRKGVPLHSPPHWSLGDGNRVLITVAFYDHESIIGKSHERMTECEHDLLSVFRECDATVYAWCVLPNHYHVLARIVKLKTLTKAIGLFHGRSSFRWNGEDDSRGRGVWYRCFDRTMRSEGHFWATVNYVLNNPVHHGYVDNWTDWVWSSATDYLAKIGREKALEIWREYPILDYGNGWDD